MREEIAASSNSGAAKSTSRRPYTTPVLRVFGTVAAMTAAAQPSGTQKDGGPNNTKT